MNRSMHFVLVSLAAVALLGRPVPARAQAQVEMTAAEPQAQVKDDLFAGTEKFAQGAKEVSDLNLGPDMLALVTGTPAADTARKLNYVVVHSYEYAKPGMYKAADVEVYRQKLRNGNWNCFIHDVSLDTGESTDICTRPSPDHTGNEMVILDVEPKELDFIHISGTASLADLAKLRNLANHPPEPPVPPTTPAPPSAPAPPK